MRRMSTAAYACSTAAAVNPRRTTGEFDWWGNCRQRQTQIPAEPASGDNDGRVSLGEKKIISADVQRRFLPVGEAD